MGVVGCDDLKRSEVGRVRMHGSIKGRWLICLLKTMGRNEVRVKQYTSTKLFRVVADDDLLLLNAKERRTEYCRVSIVEVEERKRRFEQ